MENGWSWEQKTLTSELIQGMELANYLRVQFSGTSSSPETMDMLLQMNMLFILLLPLGTSNLYLARSRNINLVHNA